MATPDETMKGMALGDAYERAFRLIDDHAGGCARCAWFGDYCEERERLVDAFLVARARARTTWRGRRAGGKEAR